ncbi:multi-sensor signal transduction histidine kinase [Calothrix sp. NIES-4071]|nr:multi-sensor signal transduction histidine kinase [Calothrix sp. NIES-4071]BAZ56474.1 multi-sensor signal transduction histidine kinase [Calothrix sp. NIES-4105]
MKSADSFKNVQQSEQEGLVYRIIDQIRRTKELQEILNAVVVEVSNFLQTDRVIVYRFDREESGEVVAESIEQQRLPSLLGLHFPASDIIEYLKAMGVQSELVLPITEKTTEPDQVNLWGLLVSHHSQPRTILKRELRVLQQVVDQISIAIIQSNLVLQARIEQRQKSIINQVITQLHSLPTIQLQAALETTTTALSGCGGRMYIYATGELYTYGEQPKLPESLQNTVIEEHPFWQHWMEEFRKDSVWTITDIYNDPELKFLTNAFEHTNVSKAVS